MKQILDINHAIKFYFRAYSLWLNSPIGSEQEAKWAKGKNIAWNMIRVILKRNGEKHSFNRAYSITRHMEYLAEKRHWPHYGMNELNHSITRR